MYTKFFRTICQMGIFLLCAQSIVHFRPRGSYEKYLKLLVGIMLLLQLLVPVGSLLLKEEEGELKRKLWEAQEELEAGLREAEENAAISSRRLEAMTLEEVQKRLEEEKAAEISEEMTEAAEKTEEAAKEITEAPVTIEPVEQIQKIQKIQIEGTDREGQDT